MIRIVIATIAAVSVAAMSTSAATTQLAPSNQSGQLQRSTAQRIAQLDMRAVPTLDQDKIRQVQLGLRDKGFDPGPIDGVAGVRTKEAVRNFQDRYGMQASGEIDNQTLYALGKPELAEQPSSEPDHGR
jgi:peptidoglycan hydrolase-like protein with peptidoglycan-binding domain